jgi:hypothetical protein
MNGMKTKAFGGIWTVEGHENSDEVFAIVA